MPFSINDPEIMREIIVDNYQNPRNFKEVNDDRYITIHMDSASCIDDIYIQVLQVIFISSSNADKLFFIILIYGHICLLFSTDFIS